MQDPNIDHGVRFDWGRASADYARYRDIYPPAFYDALISRGLCTAGQRVLDLGTGTGALPRALYRYGADFTGVDAAPAQIEQAKRLAAQGGMDIRFFCARAEDCRFPEGSFDAVTACQCFVYFDHAALAPLLHRWLRPGGRFAVLYMAWLPGEDEIAARSEELILRCNPAWTGCGETRHPIAVPPDYDGYFVRETQQVFDLPVHFSRESWHGRIRACRGVGASLDGDALARFDAEHRALLARTAPPEFDVLHYAAVTILRRA